MVDYIDSGLATETVKTMGNLPYQSALQNWGDSILILTNPDEDIEKLELFLRNQARTPSGIVALGPPLLNEQGINSVMSQVRSLASQTSILSNQEEKDVQMLMMSAADTLIKDLMLNRVSYGIADGSLRDVILTNSTNTMFVCLKRAYMQGERKFVGHAHQDYTVRMEGSQTGSPSFLSRLWPFGGKK